MFWAFRSYILSFDGLWESVIRTIPAEGLGYRMKVGCLRRREKDVRVFFWREKNTIFPLFLGKNATFGWSKGVDMVLILKWRCYFFCVGGEGEEFEWTFFPNSFAAWDTLTSEWLNWVGRFVAGFWAKFWNQLNLLSLKHKLFTRWITLQSKIQRSNGHFA